MIVVTRYIQVADEGEWEMVLGAEDYTLTFVLGQGVYARYLAEIPVPPEWDVLPTGEVVVPVEWRQDVVLAGPYDPATSRELMVAVDAWWDGVGSMYTHRV